MIRYNEKQNDIKIGDQILTGKFKNKKAKVVGFGKNDKE